MIADEINTDELILHWYKNIKSNNFRIIYHKFLRNCDNKEIFLFNLIHRNYYSFNEVDEDLFLSAMKTDLLVFKLIVCNLMNYCSDPGLIKLLDKPQDVSLSDHLKNTSLQSDTQKELNRLFSQFQLHLRCGNPTLNKTDLNQLPCEIIRKIVNFDNTLVLTNREYYVNGSSLSDPTNFFIEGKIHSLENKIEGHRQKIGLLQDNIAFVTKFLNDLKSVEHCGSKCVLSGRHILMGDYFFHLERQEKIRKGWSYRYSTLSSSHNLFFQGHPRAHQVPLGVLAIIFPMSVKERVSYFNSISDNSIRLSDSQNKASLKLFQKKDKDILLQESHRKSTRQRFGLLSVYRHYSEEYLSSPTLFSRSKLEIKEQKGDEKSSSLESKSPKITRRCNLNPMSCTIL